MFLPGNLIYEMSSWTRAIVMPLSILHAMNPRAAGARGIHGRGTASCRASPLSFQHREKFLSWRNFFFVADRLPEVRGAARQPRSLRQRAITAPEHWILERTRHVPTAWARSIRP